MSEDRTPDPDSPGRRLERYISSHWSRQKGGIRGLASKMGTTPESMYAWFRNETEPTLGSLTKIAEALSVSRVDVLAAMDGELLEPSEDRTREIAQQVAEAVILRAIEQGRLTALPQTPPGRRRADGPR